MKKISYIVIFLLALILLTSCGDKPPGEPKETIEQYFQSLDDGNTELAYSLLTKENQSQISLDEFKDWQAINSLLQKPISFKVSNEEVLKKYSFNGKDYNYAIKYTISYKDEDYITEKEISGQSTKWIVSENKEWKVLDEENYRLKYAIQLDYIGWAYREGMTFANEVNTAINYFLKSIEVYPDYSAVYYDIAYAYSSKEQYDKAIQYTDTGITKEKDNENLSNLYNLKGTCLIPQRKYAEAKAAFEKALEHNSNNSYASDNLAHLNDMGY